MKGFLFILQARNWHWLSWRVWAGTHVALTVPGMSAPCWWASRREAVLGASSLGAWRAWGLSSAGERMQDLRSSALIWGKALHLVKPRISRTYHEKGEGWVFTPRRAVLSSTQLGLGAGTELMLPGGWLWLIVSCCFCWTVTCNCRHRHFCLAFVVFQVEFTSTHLNFMIEQGWY